MLRRPKAYFYVNYERDLTAKKRARAEQQAAKLAKKYGASGLNLLGGGLPVYIGDFDAPRYFVTADGEWLTPDQASERRLSRYVDATMRGDLDAKFEDPALLFSGLGRAVVEGEIRLCAQCRRASDALSENGLCPDCHGSAESLGEAIARGSLNRIEERIHEDKRTDAAERLKKLAELRDAGIVTDEEFQSKKAKLLDEI